MLGLTRPHEMLGWKVENGVFTFPPSTFVEIESGEVETSKLYVDHIAEKTAAHGVAVDNVLKVDHIAELTGAHGVAIDHPLTVNGRVTSSTLTVNSFIITVSGACTLNDWFDQSVKQAASPSFAGITINSKVITVNGACVLNDWFDQSVKQGATPTFNDLILTAQGNIYVSSDTSAITIAGGNAAQGGANLLLFGHTHATIPDYVYLRGAYLNFQNQGGTVTFFRHSGSHFYVDTGNLYVQGGALVTSGYIYPGSGSQQTSYYLYYDSGWTALRTNGSLYAEGSIYGTVQMGLYAQGTQFPSQTAYWVNWKYHSTEGDLHFCFNAGATYYQPSWVAHSDKRLKKDIQDMENVLDKVLLMKPSTFLFTEMRAIPPYDRLEMGFVADDVKDLIPLLVGTAAGTDQMLTFDYPRLGVIAIKALQEHYKITVDIKTKADLLEVKVKALEEKIK